MIERLLAALVIDRYARAADENGSEVRVHRITYLLLEHHRVRVLALVAVEDEADVNVEVAIQRHYAGVHGIATLVEVSERRYVGVEVISQRLDDGVTLLAQGRLLVVFVETDGAVEVFKLLLNCRHLAVLVFGEKPRRKTCEQSEGNQRIHTLGDVLWLRSAGENSNTGHYISSK